jgi:hypothetical protein
LPHKNHCREKLFPFPNSRLAFMLNFRSQRKERFMLRRTVTLPEIGLIAGTRAAAGAGIGLLLADRLNKDQRRAVGWTLLAVGAITTIPLLADLLLGHEQPVPEDEFVPDALHEEEMIAPKD